MSIEIRSIKQEDVNNVYELLIELARHEKIEDRFKLTIERMHIELFGPNADWNCLVATTKENKIIGFCLYSFANINRAFNTTPLIHIDDIFVKTEFRNSGLGKKLLKALAKIAHQRGINRIELWCIKDNAIGQLFYTQLNARKLDFLDVYQLQVGLLLEN